MANWLDKALGRNDGSLDQIVPYEIDCVCGTRTSGVRTARAKRVICAQCGEPHFVLPANVYPESDRQYFENRGAGPVASAAPVAFETLETLDESSELDLPLEPFQPMSPAAQSQVPPPLPNAVPAESEDEIIQFKTASEADHEPPDHEPPDQSVPDSSSSEPEISFEAASTSELPTLDESSGQLDLDEPILQMPDGPLELVEMPPEPEPVADVTDEEDDGLLTIPLRYESSNLEPPPLDDSKEADVKKPQSSLPASDDEEADDEEANDDDDWMNDIVSELDDEPQSKPGTKPALPPDSTRGARSLPREVDLKPKRSDEPTKERPLNHNELVARKPDSKKSTSPSSQTSKPNQRNKQKKQSKMSDELGFDDLEELLEREAPRPQSKSRSTLKSQQKPSDSQSETTEFTTRQKLFLAVGAVVAVLCGLALYSFRSSSLEELEITLNADLEAGETAMEAGNFAEARRRFEAALSAMQTLGVTDQRADRVRLMHLESEAMVRLFDDDPVTVVEAAHARLTNGKWSEWQKEFDRRFAGKWLILDQSAITIERFVDDPPTGDKDFDAAEHPASLPRGRSVEYPVAVDGSRIFIAGVESALVASRVTNDAGAQTRLVFAGRMTGCRRLRDGGRDWVIELEPESVFLWHRFESLAQLGFGLEDDLELREVIRSQREAVDRTLELADRETQR